MSRNQQRRASLRTEADDLYYDEYLRQRDGSRSRRSDRLPPLPLSDNIISLTSDDRRQPTSASVRTLQTRDSIRSTSTVASVRRPTFTREGYEQLNSRLGNDHLTAVRLMRAQLAQMSLKDKLNDRDVKSQFAREASRLLSKAEQELELLQRRRTDALISGDTVEARRITREMEDIRSKATYDAYADLLMNERQLASYGIRSKYSQDNRRQRYRDYSPRRRGDERRRGDYDVPYSRGRSSYEDRTFTRYIRTPPNAERSVSRGRRDRRRPFTGDSVRSQTAPPTRRRRRDKITVKRNKRLADMPPPPKPKTPPPKPPKTPPTNVPPTPERGEPGYR